MEKKEKTRKEKFKEAQNLDRNIASLVRKLTKIVGDKDKAESMVALDFGYRNICGFVDFVPKGKDPNAPKICKKMKLDIRKAYQYEYETLISIFWYILGVGVNNSTKYFELLNEVGMVYKSNLKIKSIPEYVMDFRYLDEFFGGFDEDLLNPSGLVEDKA